MYKVSISDLHEIYLKGYVDGGIDKPIMENGVEVMNWLQGMEIAPTAVETLVDGVATEAALNSWQTEIINKEIDDFYLDDTEEISFAGNPFGDHFKINPNSVVEK